MATRRQGVRDIGGGEHHTVVVASNGCRETIIIIVIIIVIIISIHVRGETHRRGSVRRVTSNDYNNNNTKNLSLAGEHRTVVVACDGCRETIIYYYYYYYYYYYKGLLSFGDGKASHRRGRVRQLLP